MALVSYLFGIGLHSLFAFTRLPDLVWWIAIPILMVLIVSWPRRGLLVLCAFVLGVWRFDLTIPRAVDGVMPWIGESVTCEGRLERVTHRGSATQLIIDVDRCGGAHVRGPGARIAASSFTRTPMLVGTRVRVTCVLANVEDSFSAMRDAWSMCRGTTKLARVSSPVAWDVSAMLAVWHDALSARIQSLYPPEEGQLLTGILYGDQDLSTEQRDVMQRAGLMHIVAVSGSNVTIVVAALMSLAFALRLSRRHAFYASTVGIFVFSLFVGASSSVVRAAMMGWLVLFARHVGRLPSASRILLLSAVGLTLLHPWVLVFDAGFALSFFATWGLMAWTPIVSAHAAWLPERFGIREAFATTTSATIMTLPYLGFVFGRMSLAGLLTNILALPLVPFIMVWGAIAAVLGPVVPIVALPAHGLVALLERVAHLSDLVPFLDVRVDHLGFFVMIGLYLVIGWVWIRCVGITRIYKRLSQVIHNCCHVRD